MATDTGKTIIDGITYHTTLSGASSDPVVLLVHALMSNHHMWDSTVRALNAAGYRTLAFDHIGHNFTSGPADSARTYTVEDMTHHMHALVLAATGSQKLHAVIGCSIGGVLALRYGMLFPSKVGSVISLCAPGITSPEATKPLWTQRIELFERDFQALCRETVARWIPGPESWDESVRMQALEHVRTCSREGYEILADAIRGYDYAGDLARLKGVRCLVLAGGRDGAVRSEILRELAEDIQKATGEAVEYLLMEDAGHVPPMHRPEEFKKLAVDFLRKKTRLL